MDVSRSPVGRSKYSHHIEKTMRSAPRATPIRGRSGVPASAAVADGDRAGEDALAEHDDGEEAVALGDVVAVPAQGLARAAQMGTNSSPAARSEESGEQQAVRQEQQRDPAELHDGHADDPADGVGAVLWIGARGPRPRGSPRPGASPRSPG